MGPDPPDDFHFDIDEGASVTKLSASALGKRKATAADTENKKAQQQMSHVQREYVHARRCTTPEPHTKTDIRYTGIESSDPSTQSIPGYDPLYELAPGGDMNRYVTPFFNAYFSGDIDDIPGPGPYY